MKLSASLLLLALALVLMACGNGGEDTTKQEGAGVDQAVAELRKAETEKEKAEVEKETARIEAKVQASKPKPVSHTEPGPEPEPEPEASRSAPDTVGMRLPQARTKLENAGFRVKAENTDTMFGIVVPSHYKICEQSDPEEGTVTVLAQKYGC